MAKKKKIEVIECEEEVIQRYRCFTCVLYEETSSYNIEDVLFNIKGYKYWAIVKHQPEEDEKKVHYHVIIKLDNACTLESISKKLGVPLVHIKYVRNIRAMCRYLIHMDDPDKIQYSIDDVQVSKLFERKFKKNFEEIKSEEEIIQDIYFWLDNSHFDSYSEKLRNLLIFVNYNCYDTIYKRYRYEFLDYLKLNL